MEKQRKQVEEAQKNVIYDYSELHNLRVQNLNLSSENQELNNQLPRFLNSLVRQAYVVLFWNSLEQLWLTKVSLAVVRPLIWDGTGESQEKMKIHLLVDVYYMPRRV